ncbi:MAG: hypothetical protein K8S99_01655 [Planctomycetes bacterium]|nr:hypothetical protein [Planctomycetota bacterium]
MKKPHEPLPEDLPKLAERLATIHHRRIDVPPEIDERILAAARAGGTRQERGPAFRFRLAPWAAVAAVLAIGVTVALFTRGFDRSARGPVPGGPGTPGAPGAMAQQDVTILDAFALARTAQASTPEDKQADPAAIDALAYQAVALAPPNHDTREEIAPASPTPAPPADRSAPPSPRFVTVHVTLDPGGRPLAAYQLRITARGGVVKVVGIESGDGRAFAAKPPYYDRAAENRDTDELAIAMFTTADAANLPRGPVRVASLHLVSYGDAAPLFETKLIAAADHDGNRIDAVLSIKEGTPP